jgi:hypothetical protein
MADRRSVTTTKKGPEKINDSSRSQPIIAKPCRRVFLGSFMPRGRVDLVRVYVRLRLFVSGRE